MSRKDADERWCSLVSQTVPEAGLVDVHTYAVILRDDFEVAVDVTFPLPDWDGNSDVPLACGDGEDVAGGQDPLRTKVELLANYCDPGVREPFIAALASASTSPAPWQQPSRLLVARPSRPLRPPTAGRVTVRPQTATDVGEV